MGPSAKIDHSFKERRAVLELLEKLGRDDITFQELEQIGGELQRSGSRALRPLLRQLSRESSGEIITRYAYLLDFFDTESWLSQITRLALTRRDLSDDGKAALFVVLEGYGIDLQELAWGVAAAPLSQVLRGALLLGDEGLVAFLDDFLGYPSELQKLAIVEMTRGDEPQGVRLLEAILSQQDGEIVQAALAALGKIRHPLAAGALARFLADGDPSHARQAEKSLRRLCFLGIQPPPPKIMLPFHVGYATSPDGDGYRALFFSRWTRVGKLAVLYLQIHERRGLLAAWGASELTEADMETEVERFGFQEELREVPIGYLLELVRDALYHSEGLSYLPADFYLRRDLFAGHDLTPAPYRPCFTELAPARRLSYREGEDICRELFAHPLFAGRMVPTQRLHGLFEECLLDQAGEQALERLCQVLLAPELELIQERLLSSADFLRQSGRDAELAKKVAALAQSLAVNPLPHHLHPFLRALALESMETARAALARGEADPQHNDFRRV